MSTTMAVPHATLPYNIPHPTIAQNSINPLASLQPLLFAQNQAWDVQPRMNTAVGTKKTISVFKFSPLTEL